MLIDKQHYVLQVNSEFDFDSASLKDSLLDIQQLHHNHFHILKNHESISAEILTSNFLNRTYQVKINGNTYEVQIKDALDSLIKEMGLSLGAAQVINDIKAPMPGLILEVDIKNGDQVKQGDSILVLEAMKMENTLVAPRDGVVKSVIVSKGDTVEKNQVLVEME
ncbi:MAG TPA: acetyl-CoA carboxylase biotin carboxyl carrier protein subunit [Salinimicrobium sp.]|nr:acetyl-CoA carboxylase biotin carboxyl carrier protein subunit [Salinimicrobium sp.]